MVEWCGAWKEVLVPAVLHSLPKKCSKEHPNNSCDSLFAYEVTSLGYPVNNTSVCMSSMSTMVCVWWACLRATTHTCL